MHVHHVVLFHFPNDFSITEPMIACSVFIYQDENEDENQSFRLFLCVLKQTCDERTNNYMQCNTLGAWFVRHRHNIEQTKTFVFGFIFAFLLAHKQAISR